MKWSDLYFKRTTNGATWGIDYREAEAGKAEGLGLWYRLGSASAVRQRWDTFYLRIYLEERQKQDLLKDQSLAWGKKKRGLKMPSYWSNQIHGLIYRFSLIYGLGCW